ncbi:TRAP transporter small permease [Vibrio lamellibrachiae]|uniref:TRAP transporter small permease subunit n=1 Tax=Vibrio lamellibrachiae TaxID=2910253 RepID=UPI003D14F446
MLDSSRVNLKSERNKFETILLNYCRAVRYIVWAIGRSVSFLIPLLAGIVAYEVLARYFLDSPTIWAYDTSLFLFGYISALGGAYAQQKKSHINVDVLYLHVPMTVKRLFSLITIILAVGFLVVMANICFEKFLETLEYGFKRQSEWAPSVHHFWLMITVASVIFIAEYSVQFINHCFALITGRELLPGLYQEEHAAQNQPDNADTKSINQGKLANKEKPDNEKSANHAESVNVSVGGEHGN